MDPITDNGGSTADLSSPSNPSPQTNSVLLPKITYKFRVRNSHPRILVLDERGTQQEAYLDTECLPGLIGSFYLAEHYPSKKQKPMRLEIAISGIGLDHDGNDRTIADHYADIRIRSPTSGKSEVVFRPYRLLIVPYLPGGMLLGNYFLIANHLDVHKALRGYLWGGRRVVRVILPRTLQNLTLPKASFDQEARRSGI